MMKTVMTFLLGAMVLLAAGCSKEEPAQNPPPPPVSTPATQTLHKAEDLNQVVTDEVATERKQIDAATQ